MSPPSRTSVQPWRRSQRYELERLEGGWYEARIEEFPEVFTAAPSREEARVAVFDALAQYLAACRDTGREPLVKGTFPRRPRPDPARQRLPVSWIPMSRGQAEAVLAEPRVLGGILPLETAAREYEAQLVTQGKSATEIYELLTDFLGRRPDSPEEEPSA